MNKDNIVALMALLVTIGPSVRPDTAEEMAYKQAVILAQKLIDEPVEAPEQAPAPAPAAPVVDNSKIAEGVAEKLFPIFTQLGDRLHEISTGLTALAAKPEAPADPGTGDTGTTQA